MKFFALLVFSLLAFSSSQRSLATENLFLRSGPQGLIHGTYFAFQYSTSKFIVAIESRRGDTFNGQTTYHDDSCKIMQLSDDSIFFAAGIIASADNRMPPFNGFDLAFSTSAGTTRIEAARRWSSQMTTYLRNIYSLYSELIDAAPDQTVVDAYFVGFGSSDIIEIINAKVIHEPKSPVFVPFVMPIVPMFTPSVRMLGPKVLVEEFMMNSTPRSKAVQADLQRRAKSSDEKELLALNEIVRSVPLWAGDLGSGGPIAMLELTTNPKNLRWIDRPPFCK